MELNRWEKHFLRVARCGSVWIPLVSKAADSLIDHGLISGFGMIFGHRAQYQLTEQGRQVSQQLKDASYEQAKSILQRV